MCTVDMLETNEVSGITSVRYSVNCHLFKSMLLTLRNGLRGEATFDSEVRIGKDRRAGQPPVALQHYYLVLFSKDDQRRYPRIRSWIWIVVALFEVHGKKPNDILVRFMR